MAYSSCMNFDLLLHDMGNSYQAHVIDSPAGQATHTFTLPVSDLELEKFILKIGRSRSNSRSLDIAVFDAPPIEQLGGALFKSIFNGSVAERFRSSLAIAQRENNRLRIRLRLSGAPKLIDIPWELLFDEETNNFICLSVNTPIIRKLDLATLPKIQPTQGVLQVLVMISSPANYPQLDVESEWNRINDATLSLQQAGRIVLSRVEPSLTALQQRVRSGEYQVFHYIGHGGFDPASNDGVLVLEDRDKQGQTVSGQSLGTILHDETTLQLVLLNSCNGGRTSITDPFAGVGQSLLQKGIPTVIAMQFEISDEAAITFSSGFYASLVDGYPIDAAIAEARKMIYAGNNQFEWATPVLYTSTDSNNPLVNPVTVIIPDPEVPVTPEKPAWANETGQDQYGNYADLLINGVTQRFRWIKPGKFWMGSPTSEFGREGRFLWFFTMGKEAPRQVTLTKGFWLADTTCTQALWEAVAGYNPSHFNNDKNNPVETVSWNEDIQIFLQKLNALAPGLNATLPTEAQWEYACRAGTTTPFSFGRNVTSAQVNYDGSHPYTGGKKESCRGTTIPVKSLPPNPWGLHEMHGNVWELCRDTYQKKLPARPVIDPKVTTTGNKLVIRGGSCFSSGKIVRSAMRHGNAPNNRDNSVGFRLAINAQSMP